MKRVLITIASAVAFACIIGMGAATSRAAQAPAPINVTGWAAFVAAPDSTVKLGTRLTVTGWWAGQDTVVYTYYRGTTLLRTNRAAFVTNSYVATAPAYGDTDTFKGCAQVERSGRTSGVKYPETPVCWTWDYLRPPPSGTIDSIFRVAAILLRPLGAQLAADSGGVCASWLAAHPNTSPFITVNVQAVPECMARRDSTSTLALKVWQYCVFAEDSSGRKTKTSASINNPYCEQQYQSWLVEAQA